VSDKPQLHGRKYRVRWTGPKGERQSYSRAVDLADAELFRRWLGGQNDNVYGTDPRVADDTWRRDGIGSAVGGSFAFGEFARTNIDARFTAESITSGTQKKLYTQVDRQFGDWINLPLNDIDRAALIRKKRELDASYTPHTVMTLLAFAYGILRDAEARGFLEYNPFVFNERGDRVPFRFPRSAKRQLDQDVMFLSDANVDRLIAAAGVLPRLPTDTRTSWRGDYQTQLTLRFMVETGCRIGEVLALQVGDLRLVDLDGGGLVYIRRAVSKSSGAQVTGKTKTPGSVREVPLAASLAAELREWTRNRGRSLPLFPATNGADGSNTWQYSSWRIARWCKTVERAHARFGMDQGIVPTPHCLRHTFASRMLAEGLSLPHLSALLGHEDVQTTFQYYAHLDKTSNDLVRKALESRAAKNRGLDV
jgi:integrase